MTLYSNNQLCDLSNQWRYYRLKIGKDLSLLKDVFFEDVEDEVRREVLMAISEGTLIDLFEKTLLEWIDFKYSGNNDNLGCLTHKLLCLLIGISTFDIDKPFSALYQIKKSIEAYWMDRTGISRAHYEMSIYYIDSSRLRQVCKRMIAYRFDRRNGGVLDVYNIVKKEPNAFLKKVLEDNCDSTIQSDLTSVFIELLQMRHDDLIRLNLRRLFILIGMILVYNGENPNYIFNLRKAVENMILAES